MKLEILDSLIINATTSSIGLQMPRYKIEYEQKLNDVLISMGMPKAFSGSAEFPYLFKEIKSGIYISRVRHKAFVEVDEEGTEAAVATDVAMTYKGMNTVITLNKPFVYIIRENTTGAILFAGKLMEPISQ